jgi:predicted O-linked N-acetylglucosamine transferase (SPINDLY family)
LKWDLAIECYDLAIEANPHLTEAYVNKGTALLRKNKPIDALSCYEQALLLNPNDADIYCNAGNALLQLKQALSAVANFDTAIRLQPDFAQVIYNRGNAYLSLKNLSKALSDFDRALELQPDIDFLQGMRLQAMMGLCKWETLNEDIQTAKKSAQLGLKTLIPFSSLAFEDDPKSLQKIASTYANALYPFNDCLGPLPKFKSKKKIKLAYFSMDFHSHPVSHLIVEVLEKHDRSQFEVIAFSFGPVTGDSTQERIKQAVDDLAGDQAATRRQHRAAHRSHERLSGRRCHHVVRRNPVDHQGRIERVGIDADGGSGAPLAISRAGLATAIAGLDIIAIDQRRSVRRRHGTAAGQARAGRHGKARGHHQKELSAHHSSHS